MGLEEAKGTTIYTRDAVHRPPSHITLIGKMLHDSKHLNEAGNQIPDDPACKTGAIGAARRSRSFSIASM
jgi:hypothetical protein